MRRLTSRDEHGASAVIVAIVVTVLFGATALAVDFSRAYEERRELQRTADLAVLAGAQEFFGGVSGADSSARQTAQCYTGDNSANLACSDKDGNKTVHHPGGYSGVPNPAGPCYDPPSDPGADCVDAGYAMCSVAGFPGVQFDCVEARVRAPSKTEDPAHGFQFLFARVLGFTDRPISAQARAVIGAGGPRGDRLVPWMVLDCPNPTLYSDEASVPPTAVHEDCVAGGGYRTSTSFNQYPIELFLATQGGSKGNFQGVDFVAEPNCPSDGSPTTNDTDLVFGHSGGSGVNAYRNWLAGEAVPGEPCAMGKGARIYPEPGAVPNPTNQGLTGTGPVPPPGRGVSESFCGDPDNFNETVHPDPTRPGSVLIDFEDNNPCLVALLFVVHPDPNNSNVGNDLYHGAADIPNLQHPDPLDLNEGRFSKLGGPANPGASELLLMRRFGLFYITDLGNASGHQPWVGVFLKALDSLEFVLTGSRCEATDDICVVKLVN